MTITRRETSVTMPQNAGQEMNERTIDKFKKLIAMLNEGRNVTEIALAVQLSVHECIQIITQQRITIMDQQEKISSLKNEVDLERELKENLQPPRPRTTKPVASKHRRARK